MMCRSHPIYVAIASAIFATVLITASPASAGGGQTANIENGRVLAESRCAHCHGVGRRDRSPVAAAPVFRDLARNWPLENLAEALAEGIVVGHPAMPAFAFSPEEIDDFLGWLGAIQRR